MNVPSTFHKLRLFSSGFSVCPVGMRITVINARMPSDQSFGCEFNAYEVFW